MEKSDFNLNQEVLIVVRFSFISFWVYTEVWYFIVFESNNLNLQAG